MTLLSVPWWIRAAVILAAGLAVLYTYKIRDARSGWLLAALIFVLLGVARGETAAAALKGTEAEAEWLDGQFMRVSGTVFSLEEGNGKLEIRLKSVRIPKMDENIGQSVNCLLVSVPEEETEGRFHIGNRILVSGEIKVFDRARNPGGFDFRRYYESMGIDARFYGEDAELLDDRRFPLPDLLSRMRKQGRENILEAAEEQDAGIFCAAVLGDKKALDSEVKDLYQRNGIAHLLAISGLHLSILGLGIYKLLRKAGLGNRGSGLVSAGFIIAYGMLTGGSPSVIRAVSMMLLVFLAACIGRTYDLLSAASLALLILAFQSPLLLLQGGVQLSFGAVFAIGGLAPSLMGLFGERMSGWVRTLLVSLSIQLVTLPVVLYHFFGFPLYGMLLNLVVIPLMGVVVCSGLLTALLGGAALGAGILAAGPGHYVLRLYETLLTHVDRLPYANIIMGRPDIITISAYYLLLFGGLWVFKRFGIPLLGEKRRYGMLTALALALLCLICGRILVPGPVSGLEAAYLDVGQGDGIVLRTGNHTVLVDGGSTSDKNLGKNRLEPCLKSYGITKIDYIWISHGDRDHLSGVEYLLEFSRDIEVGCLVLPYHGRDDDTMIHLEELAKARKTQVVWGKAGDSFRVGELDITCLYPGIGDVPSDTNEESLVLRMDYEECHLLFTGDMSGAGEEKLLAELKKSGTDLREIQVLKTAHHGSRYSSTEEFLDAVKPLWAVISYQEGNSYGHPHAEVLKRLSDRKVTVYKTAERGAVFLHTDGKKAEWSQYLP